MNSLEGQSNKTGIIFRKNDHICEWSGLRLNVLIDEMNPYEMEALDMPITYCRIIRQYVRSKRKYYLQVVFKGSPPAKRRKSDGSFIHILGHGDVGIDIGTSTVAYASQTEAKILELADKAQEHEREIFLLQRKLDRSRRTTNPDNFNPDGTCKKGRKHWKRSNRYMEILFKLKEAYRKAKVVRKFQHELLSNHLLQLGDKFYVEMMNFEALKKRAKETKQDEKTGRCKRKKRFGKSVGNRAPAMFLSILDRKLHYFDKELIKINTSEARASQFNHTNETYKKKKLSQRWNNINGMKIQRDMYSAFLIMNINEDLSSFNLKKCNARFASFLTMHDAEVQRLLGNKNLSSIGI